MMKKMLAVLTALLMMALPLSSLALTSSVTPVPGNPGTQATVPVPDPEPVLADMGFAAKYLAQGQRLVTDVTLEPGQALVKELGEKEAAALKDLLGVMTLESSVQNYEGLSQAALRLLLDGETAADVILAAEDQDFYVSSGFLGNRILKVTSDQAGELAQKVIQQMLDEGTLTEENLSDLTQNIQTLTEAAEALSESGNADIDTSALNEAVDALTKDAASGEELTEVPEGVSIEAKYKVTLSLTKEGLTKVTTELAKCLWSIPSMPKLLSLSGEEWTEESLVDALNRIPGILREDPVITIYMDESENNIEIHTSPKLLINEEAVDPNVVLIVNNQENGTTLSATLEIPGEEGLSTLVEASLALLTDGGAGTMEWYYTVSEIDGGEVFMPMAEYMIASWQTAESNSMVQAYLINAVTPSREAEQTTSVFDVNWEAQDLGDHAEAAGTFRIGTSEPGDLMTVNVTQTTDLAEAYIITADAVQPLAMTEAEQETFTAQTAFSSLLGLARLVSRLPSSVQVLFWNMINPQ